MQTFSPLALYLLKNICRKLDKYPMQRTRYLEKLNFIFSAFIGLLLADRARVDVANSDSSSLPFPVEMEEI